MDDFARQLRGSGVPLREAVDAVRALIEQIAGERGLCDSAWSATKVDAVAVELMADCVTVYSTMRD